MIREDRMDLLKMISDEKSKGSNRYYREIQVGMSYHSNKIEGNPLTESQVRNLFWGEPLALAQNTNIQQNDMIEITNHFNAFDYIVKLAEEDMNLQMIKELHYLVDMKSIKAFN